MTGSRATAPPGRAPAVGAPLVSSGQLARTGQAGIATGRGRRQSGGWTIDQENHLNVLLTASSRAVTGHAALQMAPFWALPGRLHGVS